MNQYKHCYVFADDDKAARFYLAVDHGGYEVDWVGNAVFTNERVYAHVDAGHYIAPDEKPIWMSDHE